MNIHAARIAKFHTNITIHIKNTTFFFSSAQLPHKGCWLLLKATTTTTTKSVRPRVRLGGVEFTHPWHTRYRISTSRVTGKQQQQQQQKEKKIAKTQ